jgi:hypothetical protein
MSPLPRRTTRILPTTGRPTMAADKTRRTCSHFGWPVEPEPRPDRGLRPSWTWPGLLEARQPQSGRSPARHGTAIPQRVSAPSTFSGTGSAARSTISPWRDLTRDPTPLLPHYRSSAAILVFAVPQVGPTSACPSAPHPIWRLPRLPEASDTNMTRDCDSDSVSPQFPPMVTLPPIPAPPVVESPSACQSVPLHCFA